MIRMVVVMRRRKRATKNGMKNLSRVMVYSVWISISGRDATLLLKTSSAISLSIVSLEESPSVFGAKDNPITNPMKIAAAEVTQMSLR